MSNELIQTLREILCEVGRRVYEKGWVASNDGNLSIRVTSDEYLISPSGVSKGALTPAGILLVDGSGHTLDGDGRVSTEWKMHQKVYERRPEIGAVVHTHAPYSTAFAVAGQPLDLPVLPELVYHLGAVPLVPYYLPGSGALYDGIDPFVERANALLLKNHGLVTYGTDIWAAFYCHESVEHAARIQTLAKHLGKVDTLTREQVEDLKSARDSSGLTSPWFPVKID
jgi:L-fuculose-phosphate aldolase